MAMKIYLKDLANIADEKVYPVNIGVYEVEDNIFLRRLENVKGDITFYYDASDELRINYRVQGDMVCPCAISLEDVYVPFDLSDDDKVVGIEIACCGDAAMVSLIEALDFAMTAYHDECE